MIANSTSIMAALALSLDDAKFRYAQENKYPFASILDVKLWMQEWPNSACGFADSIVAPGIVKAATVLVKMPDCHYVYHNGRFAYKLEGVYTAQFWDAVRAHDFPGRVEFEKENVLCEPKRQFVASNT